MRFKEFFNELSLAAMTAVALYVGSKISTISESISQLNVNVAILVERSNNQGLRIDNIDQRLKSLETH